MLRLNGTLYCTDKIVQQVNYHHFASKLKGSKNKTVHIKNQKNFCHINEG